DEGEPGTFKDRLIMEGDPHGIIEGMAIAGYAVGASQGIIYIRGEYGLSIERMKNAIKQATDYGLLGKKILGTEFNFEIDVRSGAGAYVCGEETALIESLEGNRGEL
ncbi:MAG TPA: NADP oxidoreductase, partial [Firmicutes bacterium]|nr:NADP oxidoreductase [Bacillota bacterium]